MGALGGPMGGNLGSGSALTETGAWWEKRRKAALTFGR
jgi:hypothetical protein